MRFMLISSVCALQASVYLFPQSLMHSTLSTIDSVRHNIFQTFGVNDYSYQSEGLAENVWDEGRPRILIMVEGVVNPDGMLFVLELLMRELLGKVSPRYHVEDFLYSNVYGGLFREVVAKVESVKGKAVVYEKDGGIIETIPVWSLVVISHKQGLEIGEVSGVLDALKQAVQVEGQVLVFAHLTLVDELYTKKGPQSEEYQNRIKMVSEVISTLVDSQVLVVSIPPEKLVKRTEHVFERTKEESLGCYKSEKLCEKGTGNCSDHGVCVESHGCWGCLCVKSVEERMMGVKTTYWRGAACDKKDILREFQLFFWV